MWSWGYRDEGEDHKRPRLADESMVGGTEAGREALGAGGTGELKGLGRAKIILSKILRMSLSPFLKYFS